MLSGISQRHDVPVGSSSLKKTAKSSATTSSLKAGKYTVRNGTFINRARCSLRASFRRNVESIKPRHIAFQDMLLVMLLGLAVKCLAPLVRKMNEPCTFQMTMEVTQIQLNAQAVDGAVRKQAEDNLKQFQCGHADRDHVLAEWQLVEMVAACDGVFRSYSRRRRWKIDVLQIL
ncbi:unnamed protein product [Trifolium pratense]|uniref:Uncharacterized protein n=1 Tax=Trifolium pratense TaxID=57577 RepID=A0ACB0JN36_TRIPR|nr:unnamed protein product [Trifolium pratense]